ncbi:MAG: DUF4097 family beta strand repeat protein, partial [Candidatus Sericytochromatia bacterium]|nr:DUF4097 family beta strand repeat protein [Candidatus Sericytochromatia bacterium]
IGGELGRLANGLGSVEKSRQASERLDASHFTGLDVQGANQVTITAGTSDTIAVTTTLRGFGGTDEDAVKALQAIRWRLHHENGTNALISVDQPKGRRFFTGHINGQQFGNTSSVDLVIQVPARFTVKVDGNHGDVRVSGVGAAQIKTDSGRIQAEDLHGTLQAEADSGGIVGQRIAGNTTLKTDGGRITATQITGTLVAETDNGAIEVDGVTAQAELKTANGRITAKQITGPLVAETDNGAISATGAADGATLRSKHGRITGVRLAGAHVVAQTDTGSISLEQPGITGTSYDLTTEHGRIGVGVTTDASLRIDLQTEHGRLDSQLPLADQLKDDDRDRKTLKGVLKTGAQMLHAQSKTGSITLHAARH